MQLNKFIKILSGNIRLYAAIEEQLKSEPAKVIVEITRVWKIFDSKSAQVVKI